MHEEDTFQCKECEFKAGRKSELEAHLECIECKSVFHIAEKLRSHTEKEHASDSLKCDACGLVITTQESLGKHIVEFHSNPQPNFPNTGTNNESLLVKVTFVVKLHSTRMSY